MAQQAAQIFRTQSPDELKSQLIQLKKEQFNLRFKQAAGELENPARIRHVRREIARIKTVLGESSTSKG